MDLVFSPAINALGWSLIHFLWQGTVIALILGWVLQVLRNRSSHLRYAVIGLTLILMLGTFAITLIYHSRNAVPAVAIEVGASDSEKKPDGASEPYRTPGHEPDSETITYPLSIPATARTGEIETRVLFSPPRISAMLPWIVTLWIVGVVIFSLRTFAGLLHVRGCLANSNERVDPAWRDRFTALRESLHISSAVRLLSSSSVPVPIVVGWLKPAILVPTSLFSLLTVPQLEAILAHELAHIRRRDFLVNLLQNVAETIFFFHPAIWWVSAQLRKEREYCCDDVASGQCGGAVEYAKALTALEEVCATAPAMGIAATNGSLLGRVRRLLGVSPHESGPAYSWPVGVSIFLLVASLVTGAHFVNGGQNTDEPVVRGYSLAGVPRIPHTTDIPEIRDQPHFTMPVEGNGDGPILVYPAGNRKPHFYIRFPDRTYGPIGGDPFERMNLIPVLADQLEALDKNAVTDRLIGMLDLGDEVVLEASYRLIPQLKNYDHQAVAATLRKGIHRQLRSTTIARSGMAVLTVVNEAFLAAVRDEARERWDAMRTEIPESDYHPGNPFDKIAGDSSIQWGEPDEIGLRLGVSGIDTAEPIPVGSDLEFNLFIRNDGDKEVRFTPPGRSGAGFFVMLVTEAGWGLHQKPGSERAVEKRVRLAPGQYYEVRLVPTQTVLYNEIGVPVAHKVRPTAWAVRPGRYWVEFDYQLGIFDVNSDWGEPDPETVPGLGEWTGILAGKPLEIEFGPPVIGTARPGDTVIFSDHHVLKFEDENIGLGNRRTSESGEVSGGDEASDVWTVKDFPESDYAIPDSGESWKSREPAGGYLAAWDVGGTRLWIRHGDDGVQCLEFHRSFRDGGRWTMQLAMDPRVSLAYMPDGVRAALSLPGGSFIDSPHSSAADAKAGNPLTIGSISASRTREPR